MTDLDTTLKALVNSAVDRELAGHRVAPPVSRGVLPDRLRPAGWAAPMLAAVVVLLLAVVSVLAIDHNRARPSGRVDAAGPPQPATIWESLSAGGAAAKRAYAGEAAAALEATATAGVLVDPVPSDDDPFKAGLLPLFTVGSLLTPGPDITFPSKFASSARSGAGVLSFEFDNASSKCPPSFLIQPHHTYLILCETAPTGAGPVRFRVTLRTQAGAWEYSYEVTPT